jgi:hypothetical protein
MFNLCCQHFLNFNREGKLMNGQNNLTPDEEEALREVARGGLLQKIIPADIEDRLIKYGHIEQKLGGLVATTKGKLYAATGGKVAL